MTEKEKISIDEFTEWQMLQRSLNEHGVFSISGHDSLPEPYRAAFYRGVAENWFNLIDVQQAGRLFRLTPAGVARRDLLAEKFQEKQS